MSVSTERTTGVSVRTGLLAFGLLAPLSGSMGLAAEKLPPGVQQILPRGTIAAVTEPRFVSAAAAKIPDDAWVLGVATEDGARAYSLNLLNEHEIVNDTIGGRPIAAVW